MTRYALLIGNGDFPHEPGLAPLAAPAADVTVVAEVLQRRGGFEVEIVRDAERDRVVKALEKLYGAKSSDDTVLVYFSSHGVVDEDERLYFAVQDTQIDHWDASAVDAEVVRRLMRNCRAGRKIALLDCCYSGAFGDYVRRGGFRAPVKRLQERGTFVLTASTRLQSALEPRPGDADGASLSVFTDALVKGLDGGAGDRDGDGWITVQDLAEFVQERIRGDGQKQTPSEFAEGVTGPIPIVRAAEDGDDGAESDRPEGASCPKGGQAAQAADVFDWRRLLGYYRDCLAAEAAMDALVPLEATNRYGTWPGGCEPIFAGDGEPVAVPAELRRFVERSGTDLLLVHGYPAVLVGAPGTSRKPQVAGLVEVEVEPDAEGRLVAFAQARLNRSLMKQLGLPDDQIEELAEHVADRFVAGDPKALGALAAEIAEIAEIQVRGTLDAEDLQPRLRTQPYQAGIQNVALLYPVDVRDGGPVKNLLADYDDSNLFNTARMGETALGFLAGAAPSERPRQAPPIVAPVRLNEAQEQIIRSAMTERVTVATGPPGTGKSQLVTALVATATAAGQSVLVASTNNRAVDEVFERCDALAPGLLIRTGAKEHRDNEPKVLTELLRMYTTRGDRTTTEARARIARTELDGARRELDERHEVERDLDELAEARDDLLELFGGGRRAVADLTRPEAENGPWPRRVARARRHRWLGWAARRRIARELAVGTDQLADLDRLLAVARLWWRTIDDEGALPDEARSWEDVHRLVTAGVPEADTAFLKAHLASVLAERGARSELETRIRAMSQAWPKSWSGFTRLLKVLPGWATTAHSARSLPPRPGLFDLVIVDEAAQCSAAVVLPLLQRGRRALLIGDPHQLPPVVKLTERDEEWVAGRHGLSTRWLHERRLSHVTSTAYDAFAAATGSTHLLDEHYRCHPEIVEVPNREVYGGRLTVLTDVRRLSVRPDPPVEWIDVPGAVVSPGGGSSLNEPEAVQVREELLRLRERFPEAGLGAVTPFGAQAALLVRLLREIGMDPELIGTVHKYQGGERDIMVLSPVGAPGIRARTRGWLVRQNNLWNVAITRAKAGLVVVGDRNWWAGQHGTLIAELAAAGGHLRPAEDPLRRDVLDRLQADLERRGMIVTRAALVAGQCCDLLVRDGERDTAVFLDAANEHTSGRTLRQTLAKIDLVEAEGIGTLRVPVWRCRDDVSGVAAILSIRGYNDIAHLDQPLRRP